MGDRKTITDLEASESRSFGERIREARRVAQPAEYSQSITDIPYRLVSIFPSLALARLGMTANQITLLWILLGMVGVAALGSADYAYRVAGAFLLQVSYLLDYVDGEVARLQGRSSKRGVYFDLAGHGLIKTGLFLAMGYQVARSLEAPEILLFAFSACVSLANGYVLPFFAADAQVRAQASPGAPIRRMSTPRKLLNLTTLLFESPGLYAAVLVGTALDLSGWVVLFYGLAIPVWFLYRFYKYRYE